ncbi:hypothetical protein D3C72_2182530 [compost metagenome]
MAALDHVALGFGRIAQSEVISADHRVALPRELRNHQLRFRRLFGVRGHLVFAVNGAVLVGHHRQRCLGRVRHGNQAGGNRGQVAALGNDGGVADAV